MTDFSYTISEELDSNTEIIQLILTEKLAMIPYHSNKYFLGGKEA
jgi:hypothetical protein